MPSRLVAVVALLALPRAVAADTCFEEKVTSPGAKDGRRVACFSARLARFDIGETSVVVDVAARRYLVVDHASASYSEVPHRAAAVGVPKRLPAAGLDRVVTAERRRIAGADAAKVELRAGGRLVRVVFYARGLPLADVLAFRAAVASMGPLPWPELDAELGYPVRIEQEGRAIELVRVDTSPPPGAFRPPAGYRQSPEPMIGLQRIATGR